MISGRLVFRAASAAAVARAIPTLAIAMLAAATLPASAAAAAARGPILPPANPLYSLAVGRYDPHGCAGIHDFSPACMRRSLAMINAGRRGEGLGPVLLPANWQQLTVSQQLFVLTELERTARGLPADVGLSAGLNDAAVSGADRGRDPVGRASGFGSLWAGGEPNAIVVVADWMYEDGLFRDGAAPENLNCSASATAGCWQHRDILLHHGGPGSCGERCSVGAGYSPIGYSRATATGTDSYAEVVSRTAAGAQTFSWTAELPQLPLCEQAGDICTWAGSPVATPSGIVTVGAPRATVEPTSAPPSKPWFALSVDGRLAGRGELALSIRVGIRLFGVRAVARRAGSPPRPLQVRSTSAHSYMATARLPAGTWTVTIVYQARPRGRQPVSRMKLTVP